jgi:hypothetical protein
MLKHNKTTSPHAAVSDEAIEHHRRKAQLGDNEVHGAPWFVRFWTVTNSGGNTGKVRATFVGCPVCSTGMAEKKFNGQRTEAVAVADVLEQVDLWM